MGLAQRNVRHTVSLREEEGRQPPLLVQIKQNQEPPPPLPRAREQSAPTRRLEARAALQTAGVFPAVAARLLAEREPEAILGWIAVWQWDREVDPALGIGALVWRIEHAGDPPAAGVNAAAEAKAYYAEVKAHYAEAKARLG